MKLKPATTILRHEAHPVSPDLAMWDPLIEAIGGCRLVLLGEASHGTHEFYRDRAHITSRLITEKGFHAVAAEADWPDSYRVHRYITGASDDSDAVKALDGFKRFPAWMWRNRVMVDFLEWMRRFNANLPTRERRAGFYGIDLYSLHASIDAVIDFLKKTDPEAARRARERYSCFDHFDGDPQRYGFQAATSQAKDCEEEVVSQLVDLRRRAHQYVRDHDREAAEEFFSAEQNARLITSAEEYYRSMFRGRVATWNLRDLHMADTVDELIDHRSSQGLDTKLVIWAHNSHLGDSRATEMGKQGETNLGQLMRERYPGEVALVGFSTYEGSVTASSDWGQPVERKAVLPALPDSYEALFHRTGIPAFFLNLRDANPGLRSVLTPERLQRAIGVIYRPETERSSHYFRTSLLDQFDFIIHLDRTEAVAPLDRGIYWNPKELPETYPFSA